MLGSQDNQLAAYIRQALAPMHAEIQRLNKDIDRLKRAASVEDEINLIKGRRVFYTLTGTQDFTTSQDGNRGSAIVMTVSQDGPFIMTHYPIAMWRPTLPTNATNYQQWRPVYTWPLADQVTDTDIVNISYEMFDGGSERGLQNAAAPPILSRPDMLHELPIPTLFAPNSSLQFIPTYHDILFNGSTAPTQGTLVVGLPGYRIAG